MTELRFVCSDPAKLWAECERLVRESVDGVSAKGYRAGVLVSGGTTFLPYYTQAADLPADLFPADERFVNAGNPHNTSAMLKREWAERFFAPESVVQIVEQFHSPQETAAGYAAKLQQWNEHGGIIAAALLGVGEDGHTASLFPGQRPVWEQSKDLVVTLEAEAEPLVPRVSVTPYFLGLVARHVVVLTGSKKARIAARWLRDHENLPCGVVQPAIERVVLLDDAAALELPRELCTRL
jgi:6-phosphogluconolactonase